MIRAVVIAFVNARAGRVRELYEDVGGWGRLFPATILDARVVRTEGETTWVHVDHAEGKVSNVLRRVSPRASTSTRRAERRRDRHPREVGRRRS